LNCGLALFLCKGEFNFFPKRMIRIMVFLKKQAEFNIVLTKKA
jgi:hypothetical protein